jgi:serine/threonine protein kinase
MLDESKKKKEEEYKIGNYLVKKTLGQGTFGKVKLGIYLPTQEKVAIKILEKDRIVEKDDEIRVKREFDMLASFNHPNVILVAEIFESTDSFYSVMEYCAGGELFNFIVKRRRLNEEEAAFFYYQLINGLEYIHSLGIVHRDLKPENLLLTKDHVLKIIDFGLSNYFREGQEDLLVTPCGSPCYASPEMVAGNKYNGFKIDIWSTGIILYAMLCGYLPFEDKDNDILFEKILECKLDFPKYITDTSRDLIEKILVTDPNKRIDIPQIKEHPFFIKGKEIFEQEFSVCQIKKENNESEDENVDLNNILKDIEDRIDKDNNKDEDKDKDKNEDNNKIEKENDQNENKVKEHEIDNNNTAQRTIEDDIQNINLEQENIKPRLNTEYEERRPNLSNEELDNIDKNEKNKIKPKNKSSNKNGKKKLKIKKVTKIKRMMVHSKEILFC